MPYGWISTCGVDVVPRRKCCEALYASWCLTGFVGDEDGVGREAFRACWLVLSFGPVENEIDRGSCLMLPQGYSDRPESERRGGLPGKFLGSVR